MNLYTEGRTSFIENGNAKFNHHIGSGKGTPRSHMSGTPKPRKRFSIARKKNSEHNMGSNKGSVGKLSGKNDPTHDITCELPDEEFLKCKRVHRFGQIMQKINYLYSLKMENLNKAHQSQTKEEGESHENSLQSFNLDQMQSIEGPFNMKKDLSALNASRGTNDFNTNDQESQLKSSNELKMMVLSLLSALLCFIVLEEGEPIGLYRDRLAKIKSESGLLQEFYEESVYFK